MNQCLAIFLFKRIYDTLALDEGEIEFILSSPPLFFFLGASTAATYIFTALTCTAPKINFESCALNVEFQHFIPRFNKNFLTL